MENDHTRNVHLSIYNEIKEKNLERKLNSDSKCVREHIDNINKIFFKLSEKFASCKYCNRDVFFGMICCGRRVNDFSLIKNNDLRKVSSFTDLSDDNSDDFDQELSKIDDDNNNTIMNINNFNLDFTNLKSVKYFDE